MNQAAVMTNRIVTDLIKLATAAGLPREITLLTGAYIACYCLNSWRLSYCVRFQTSASCRIRVGGILLRMI